MKKEELDTLRVTGQPTKIFFKIETAIHVL